MGRFYKNTKDKKPPYKVPNMVNYISPFIREKHFDIGRMFNKVKMFDDTKVPLRRKEPEMKKNINKGRIINNLTRRELKSNIKKENTQKKDNIPVLNIYKNSPILKELKKKQNTNKNNSDYRKFKIKTYENSKNEYTTVSLPKYKFSNESYKKLNSTNKIFKKLFENVLAKSKHDLKISSGLRDAKKQRQLYEMNLTGADGTHKKSLHQFRRAIDVNVINSKTGKTYKPNDKDYKKVYSELNDLVQAEAKRLKVDIGWGGNIFEKLYDPVHFQLMDNNYR